MSGTSQSETPEEVNKMLAETFRKMKHIYLLLCTRCSREEQDLLPRSCACFNRTRALVGRLLSFVEVAEPCCYPGPLDGPIKCRRLEKDR